MTYQIERQLRFEAAHRLPHLPDGHKCRRWHGHNYVVTVRLAGEAVTAEGWLADYGTVKEDLGGWLDLYWDHRQLEERNDLMCPDGVPDGLVPMITTAETLAEYLGNFVCNANATVWPWVHLLHSVTVQETADTSATWVRP